MNNGSPLNARKTVRLMVALTILAWATQTLMHQWGFGADMPAEKFVPSSMGFGCTLELRNEVKTTGEDLKFRQLFRWADGDAAVFTPMAELTVARLKKGQAFQTLSLDEIRQTLREANINLGMIRFAGAMSCQVSRGDVSFDERVALEQWIESKQGKSQKPATDRVTASPQALVEQIAPETPVTPVESRSEAKAGRSGTLHDEIVADIAQRLHLSADSLEISFDPKDESLLKLAGPTFRFHLLAKRVRDLGSVNYDVTVATDSGTQKVTILAEARAWQTQVLAARSIAYKQVILADDITERRILVTHIEEEPIVTREQILSQQASRDIKPGMLITGRMIDAVPLVKAGQLITVHLVQGTIQMTTVARAVENGAFGQTIKVKNETTKDIFDVVVTAAQTATMTGVNVASAK